MWRPVRNGTCLRRTCWSLQRAVGRLGGRVVREVRVGGAGLAAPGSEEGRGRCARLECVCPMPREFARGGNDFRWQTCKKTKSWGTDFAVPGVVQENNPTQHWTGAHWH